MPATATTDASSFKAAPMSLTGLIKRPGPSGFGWSSTAREVVDGLDLSDHTILVTGANSGLGLETSRALADRGATVIVAARTMDKAQATCADIDGDTIAVACELSDPQSVRDCTDHIAALDRPLDALIANAGIMALPKRQTAHGYEKQFFVNHIGHFLLITRLIDHLADDARVVLVSSDAYKMAPNEGIQFDNLDGQQGYSAWKAYGQSKLANLLFARELGQRFANSDTQRVANAVHPGPIDTNLTRNMNVVFRLLWTLLSPLFLKTIPEGAATQTWAAVHPDAADLNAHYLADCNIAQPSSHGADADLARRLWKRSETIIDRLP